VVNVVEKRQVGEKLPKGWKWVRLEDVIDVRDGTHESPTYLPKGIPFITSKNLKFGQIDFDDVQFISYQDHERFMHRSCVSKGDILYAMIGTVGNPVIVRTDVKFSIKNVALFKFENSPFFNEYFCYLLQSPSVIQQVEALTQGGIQKFVSLKVLRNLLVPLPPLPEQKRIVGILSDRLTAIDKARTATETQLKAAKALPAAYLRQVFDSPEAQKWKRKKLGDIALISGGIQKTPHRFPSSFHRSYLTVRNVQRGWLDLSTVERFEITLGELERCRLECGDLLIVEGNGSVDHIGRNAIYRSEPEDCIHQNHLIRVRLDQTKDDPDFLSFYLNSDFGKKQMLEKAMTTTGLHTLSVSKIQQMEAPIISLENQRKITLEIKERLLTVTKLERSLQSQLNTINQLPAATLRQAFNGEL